MSDWQQIDGSSQVLHVPSGQIVQIGSDSWLALEYQAFLDGSGAPADATVFQPLDSRKAAAKAKADTEAAALIAGRRSDARPDFYFTERLRQAREADADGSIAAGEYPLLEAEVPATGATVADVATAVLAEWSTIELEIATIEARRHAIHTEIDALTTAGAIENYLRRFFWSPLFPYMRRTTVDLVAIDFAGVDVPRRILTEINVAELVAIDHTLVFG
ncbi:MAG: hypothetical protein AAFY46_01290 [Planctomycetota bacterium]